MRDFREIDFPTIRKWKKARDEYFPPHSDFPQDGFMVEDVACIFLIRTNTATAYLEFFMTNPEATMEERLKACDLLIRAAEERAIDLVYERLTGNTMIPKVMALGIRYGFATDGKAYYFFRKELTHARFDPELTGDADGSSTDTKGTQSTCP